MFSFDTSVRGAAKMGAIQVAGDVNTIILDAPYSRFLIGE